MQDENRLQAMHLVGCVHLQGCFMHLSLPPQSYFVPPYLKRRARISQLCHQVL